MREREGNATSAVKREATLRRWAGWMDKKIWNRCSLGLGHEGFCSDDWGWDPGGEGLRRKTPEAAGSKHLALENDHSGSRLRAAIYI